MHSAPPRAPLLARRTRAILRSRVLPALVGTLVAAVGCRGVPPAFGPTAAAAGVHADAALTGLARRFVDVERSPKFAHARSRLSRQALTPSRLISDTSVWTSSTADGLRTLSFDGSLRGGRYVFTARPAAVPPTRPGDSRHVVTLRRLRDGEYQWSTSVDHAIGELRAEDAAAVLSALVASPEGRTGDELRTDYRGAFPRSARALGRLLSVDSLRTQRLADGSTSVVLGIRVHPKRLRAEFPNFAKYVEKYVEPAKYRVTLGDGRGTSWLDARARDNLLMVRARVRDGRLVAMQGPPRPMPDTLQLRLDFTARFLFFDVGFSELFAEFAMVRETGVRAWDMRFRREPDWHLPLAARHLIRSPLRRPFEGAGAHFYLGVREGDGPTLLERRASGAVKESAILRWLGSLGSTAVGDFEGKAEQEENRFVAEALYAVRDDALAVLGAVAAAAR